MKRETLCDAIGLLGDDILTETDRLRNQIQKEAKEAQKKNKTRIKTPRFYQNWLVAACLLLVVLAAVGGIGGKLFPKKTEHPVKQWSSSFLAKDYFAYNEEGNEIGEQTGNDQSLAELPFAEERYFSDKKEQLEAEERIPVLEEYPIFFCSAKYKEDGSLYSVQFTWEKRGELEEYSNLSILAGYQEVEQIEDCMVIEVDQWGNIVPPAVTVTERDGISIVAEGRKDRDKTLTFQREDGWYQIVGSWNDGYEEMVELLDWLWEHPMDFTWFAIEQGDQFEYKNLQDYPEAFADCLPDFEAFGFILDQGFVTLKNDEPYCFEGHYIGHVTKEEVEGATYYETEGWTEIHWCIDTEPDVYEKQESVGRLEELDEQTVLQTLETDRKIVFEWNGSWIKVYVNADSKAPKEAWDVIQAQQKK